MQYVWLECKDGNSVKKFEIDFKCFERTPNFVFAHEERKTAKKAKIFSERIEDTSFR